MGITADQVEGYLAALRGVTPDGALDALAGLWRDEDRRTMPTPAAIRERARRDAGARVRRTTADKLLTEGSTPARDHQFGLEAAQINRRLLAREIDRAEAKRQMAAAAREHGLLPRIAAELDGWDTTANDC